MIGKRVKGLDEKGFAFKTDMSPEMKEQIRQIVREEIAAHAERPVKLTVGGIAIASAAAKTSRPLEL